jgi:glycosyltransferase involved in cell wall biosynthesis
VPPQSPRQIAYAIEALRTDRARRERFRRFGVERTTQRYGWRRIASETLAVYASATARPAQLSHGRA